MIERYFDFERMWEEEIYIADNDWGSYMEDCEVELHDITKEEAVEFMAKMPFQLDLDNCEINLEKQQMCFSFSEICDSSTEAGSDISGIEIYVIYSLKDECICIIGEYNF